jgi:hypothetical protein
LLLGIKISLPRTKDEYPCCYLRLQGTYTPRIYRTLLYPGSDEYGEDVKADTGVVHRATSCTKHQRMGTPWRDTTRTERRNVAVLRKSRLRRKENADVTVSAGEEAPGTCSWRGGVREG